MTGPKTDLQLPTDENIRDNRPQVIKYICSFSFTLFIFYYTTG